MARATLLVCLASAAACGSVGNSLPKGDAGAGGSAGPGTGGNAGAVDAAADTGPLTGVGGGPAGVGGSAGSGASGALDAGGDRVAADARVDAGPLPVSCQAIKQQSPGATSGVYTIAPLGAAQSVFCEMISGGGGWTAFHVGDNGAAPGGAHFETAADMCPDPANSCLRRLPSTVDETHEFAVKCGASVVKFNLDALAIDYLRNGLEHGWRPLTNALTIDVGIVGKANLVAYMWTGGTVENYGWIVSGPDAPTTTAAAVAATFANGYTTNTSWNYCNGIAETVPGSRVMLLYR